MINEPWLASRKYQVSHRNRNILCLQSLLVHLRITHVAFIPATHASLSTSHAGIRITPTRNGEDRNIHIFYLKQN